MNDKRNWKTPALAPLGGNDAEGAQIPAWSITMTGAKTNAGGTEAQMTGRPEGAMPGEGTYYTHTGPS